MRISAHHTRKLIGTLALVAGVLLPSSARAQWVLLEKDAHAKVHGGFDALYNLRYDEADSLFTDLARTEPDHPAGYFLLALVDWWRIVPNVDDDRRLDRYSDSFNDRLTKVIEISDQRLDRNPADIVGLFFKGAALGYRARLKVLTATGAGKVLSWGSASFDANEARKYLLESQRLAPSNSDILLGSGIFSYMVAAIPEKYPIASSLIASVGPGDKQLGLQMLRISANRAQYASVEAKYALLDILSNMEGNHVEALQIAQELHAKYPGNAVFHRYLAKSYYMTSDFAMADTVYHEILRRVRARQFGYEATLARQALYYIGDIRLRTGDYKTSVRVLEEVMQQTKRLDRGEETSWRTMAALKLGNVYDVLGRRKDAVRQYREVLDRDDYNNAHAKAKEYIAKAYKR